MSEEELEQSQTEDGQEPVNVEEAPAAPSAEAPPELEDISLELPSWEEPRQAAPQTPPQAPPQYPPGQPPQQPPQEPQLPPMPTDVMWSTDPAQAQEMFAQRIRAETFNSFGPVVDQLIQENQMMKQHMQQQFGSVSAEIQADLRDEFFESDKYLREKVMGRNGYLARDKAYMSDSNVRKETNNMIKGWMQQARDLARSSDPRDRILAKQKLRQVRDPKYIRSVIELVKIHAGADDFGPANFNGDFTANSTRHQQTPNDFGLSKEEIAAAESQGIPLEKLAAAKKRRAESYL